MKKTVMQTFRYAVLVLGSVGLIALYGPTAHASDVVKSDNADNLNLGTSWVGGTGPTGSDVGVWDNTVTGANNVNLGANLSWQGLRLANPGGAVTIGAGNTLTLGSSGINMSAATQDLDVDSAVSLGAGQTWNVAGSRQLTVGGTVSGGQALIKDGSGTASLGGASTYTGNTTVNGGTLEFTGAGNVIPGSVLINGNGRTFSVPSGGKVQSGAVTLSGGSGNRTLSVGGVMTNTSITIPWPSTLTVPGTGDMTVSGQISFAPGGTACTMSGSGTINAGSFRIANSGNINFGASGTTFNNAGNFMLGDAGGQSGNFNQSAGTVNLNTSSGTGVRISHWSNSGSSYTLSGGELNVLNTDIYVGWDGVGTLTVNGPSADANVRGLRIGRSSSGTINLSDGRLNVGSVGIVSAGGGTKNINLSGGTMGALTSWATALPLNVTADSVFDAGTDTITLNSVLSGGGGVTVTGSTGRVDMNQVNTYSGGTTVDGATLGLNAGGSSGTVRGTLTINSGGTVNTTVGNALGYGGGAKVDTLNINGGLLDNTASGDNGWGIAVNLTGGTLQSNGGTPSSSTAQLFSLGGGSAINSLASADTSYVRGRVNLRQADLPFTVADGAAATDLEVNAAIVEVSGTKGITKSGDGTMVLSSAGSVNNSYFGTTTVDGGVLAVGGGFGSNGGIRSDLTVNSGGTFRLLQANVVVDNADLTLNTGGRVDMNGLADTFGNLNGGGDITNLTANINLDDLAGDHIFSGNIDGTADILLRGNVTRGGTQWLNGDNTLDQLRIQGPSGFRLSSNGTTYCAGVIQVNIGGGFDNAFLIVEEGHELSANGMQLQEASGHKGQVYQHGGVVRLRNSAAEEGALRVGHWGGDTSTYYMNGGELYITNSGTHGKLSLGIDGVGVFNLNGGTVEVKEFSLDERGFTAGNTLNVTGGVLRVGSGGITTEGGGYAVNLGGGTIGSRASWGSPLNMTLTGAGGATTFAPYSGDTVTLSGTLSGAGSLVKNDAGTLSLTQRNTYAGGTSVDGGILVLNSANAATSVVGPGDLTVNNATVQTYVNSFGWNYQNSIILNTGTLHQVSADSHVNDISMTAGTISGAAYNLYDTITVQGSASASTISAGTLTLSDNITFDVADGAAADDLLVSSVIAGGNTLTKSGDGTMTMNGAGGDNTYSGLTTVDGGVLAVGSGFGGDGAIQGDLAISSGGTFRLLQNNVIKNASGINVASGGLFDMNGKTDALGYFSGDGDVSGSGGVTLDNLASGQTRVFNGNLAGTGALTLRRSGAVAAGGTQQLNGTNTFTGINIQGNNKLHFGGNGNTVLSGTLAVNTGGGLDNAELHVQDNHVVMANRLDVQNASGHKGQIYQTGGVVDIVDTTFEEGPIRIGHWPSDTSTYYMQGGALYVTNSGTHGKLALGVDGNGVLELSGGLVMVRELAFDERGGGGHGTLTMTGGELRVGDYGVTAEGGSTITVSGGTISSYESWSSSLAMTLAGLATFAPASGDTISLSSALSGSGSLISTNEGTLVLTGANTYTGTTLVAAGTLLMNGTHTGAGDATVNGGDLWGTGSFDAAVTVNSGGSIGPVSSATLGSFTVDSLTLADGGRVACHVNGSTPTLDVTNTLTTAGDNWIDLVLSAPLAEGTYTLIDYDGSIAGDGFSAFKLAGDFGRTTVSLSNNTVDASIHLVVGAAVPTDLVWRGNIDEDWDVTTTNWVTAVGLTPYLYANGDTLRFDDTAITNVVNVTTVVGPESITVDSDSTDFILSGSAIGGDTSLTKDGTSTLSLNNANTYTGPTVISNGTIVATTLANGGAASSIGAAASSAANLVIANGATLLYPGVTVSTDRGITASSGGAELDITNAATTVTLTSAVVGGNTLTKSGAGSLTMSAGNNVVDIFVDAGTLLARGGGWSTSFAANRTVTVNTNATLDTVTHSLGGVGGATRPNTIVLDEGTWQLNNEQYLPNSSLTMIGGATAGGGEIRGGGTVNVNASATASTLGAGINMTGAITVNVADGAAATDLQITGGVYNNNWLTIAGEGTTLASGVMSLSGRLVKNDGGTLNIDAINTMTGNVNINDGTVAVPTGQSLAWSTSHKSGTDALVIQGGALLEIWSWDWGTGRSLGKLAYDEGTFRVNDGTVRMTQSVGGANRSLHVGASGATIEAAPGTTWTWAGGGNRIYGSGTLSLGNSGDGVLNNVVAASGGLIKNGLGDWTLNAANTYSGNTTINAGELALGASGSIASSPTVTVGSSGVFDVSAVGGGFNVVDGQVLQGNGNVNGNVTLDSGSTVGPGASAGTLTITGNVIYDTTATNVFELGASTVPGSGTNDLLVIDGDVNFNDSRIVISELATLAGNTNYLLITYTGIRTGTNTLVSLGVGRQAYGLDYSTAGEVRLVVSGASQTLIWVAQADNNWDESTANWTNLVNQIQEAYQSGDYVQFTDLGGASNIVDVTATLEPGSVTVNSSSNYTFSGIGKISGVTDVIKSGSGSLTLNTVNDFSGGLTVQGGIVDGVAGGLGGDGAGVTVQNGGAVDLSAVDRSANRMNVTLSGTGASGSGAIYNSGATLYDTSGIRDVTLAGDATVTANNRWDMRGDGTLNLAGNTLTKAGSAAIAVKSTPGSAGTINVAAGQIAFESNFTGLSTTNASITVQAGAGVGAYDARTIASDVTLNGSTAEIFSQGGSLSTWSGTVALSGGGRVNTTTTGIEISGALSGSGTLDITGGRNASLTGSSPAFTGKFNVSGASTTLRLASDAALGTHSGADTITLTGNGRLQGGTASSGADVSIGAGRGITIPSGQKGYTHVWTGYTLTHAGTISGGGNLYKTDGGVLELTGTDSHTGEMQINAGTLTVSGSGAITQPFGFRNRGGGVTINVEDSASVNATGYMVFGDNSGASATINQTGGTVANQGTVNNPGGNDMANRWGHWGGGASVGYNLSGGTLSLLGAPLYLSWDSPATLTISGSGEANIKGFNMGYGTRNNASTINLNAGGTLNVGSDGIVTGGTSSKNINLSGGELGSLATWSTSRPITLTGTSTIAPSSGDTITLSGALSGTGGFTKDDDGSLTLSNGGNSYSGDITISNGTVTATSSASGGNSTLGVKNGSRTITIASGGTLYFTVNNVFGGGGLSAASLPALVVDGGTMSSTRFNVLPNITLNGGVLTQGSSDGPGAYEGYQLIGSITVGGASASTMAQTTGKANHLLGGSTTSFAVADATGDSVADLVVSTSIKDGSGDYSGVGSLAKSGLGTMLVSANCTYTGTTSLNGGALFMNATHSGAGNYTVASSATLSGSGTVSAGTTTVQSGATLDAGAGPAAVGTLTLNALTMDAGSTLHVDVASVASADRVTVSGSVSLAGSITASALATTLQGAEWLVVSSGSAITGTLAPPAGRFTVEKRNGDTELWLIRGIDFTTFRFR